MVQKPRRGGKPHYKPVEIPTDQSFLKQWYQWTHSKVAMRFRRDRERIADTAQRVRCRLMQKEFTSRWFFKHLKDELVDRSQAERILGGTPVSFIGSLKPVVGHRMDPDALWRVSDILGFAKFDHDRYFYSVQGHTVDSDRALELLGYAQARPRGETASQTRERNGPLYVKLQSLWRQGRLLPSELTEHECRRRGSVGASPRECPECQRGLALLRAKRASLADDWGDTSVYQHLQRIRWNDSQLKQFLRHWRKTNRVFATPLYIMRPSSPGGTPHGIDAGLLAYVDKIIGNEVINDFKYLSRTDDMPKMVYNNGMSPESSDGETVAYDSDSDPGEDRMALIACDQSAVAAFGEMEQRSDISALVQDAELSDDELGAIRAVDLMEMTVRQYAESCGLPPQKVHRLRSSAIRKLRSVRADYGVVEAVVREVRDEFGCSRSELFGPSVFGQPVIARTELFSRLHEIGMSDSEMASYFGYPKDKVAAALLRAAKSSRLGL